MAGEAVTPRPTAVTKTFACPHCGASVVLRAAGHSLVVTCSACRTLIDAADENYRILAQYQAKKTFDPLIPLGQRGKLRGELYEVIGYLRRTDRNQTVTWEEYLLFNPYQGFRWLHHYHGHWTYILTTKSKPMINRGRTVTASYLGRTYRLFDAGQARVAYVLGEFYWRVQVGDTVDTQDFVLPPQLLSMERDRDEIVWSLGEYIEPEDVKAAFQIQGSMPVKIGVAPNQPSPIEPMTAQILTRALVSALLLILIQMWAVGAGQLRPLDSENLLYDRTDRAPEKTSQHFDVTGTSGNVGITIQAPNLQNNWLDIELELVDDATGASFPAEKTIEYYSGVDSDGAWSEGSQHAEVIIPAVPPGTYHLAIEATAGPGPAAVPYHIDVRRGVPVWSNLWVALGMVLIVPLFARWRQYAFELTRWSESDYSPYPSQRDDDD